MNPLLERARQLLLDDAPEESMSHADSGYAPGLVGFAAPGIVAAVHADDVAEEEAALIRAEEKELRRAARRAIRDERERKRAARASSELPAASPLGTVSPLASPESTKAMAGVGAVPAAAVTEAPVTHPEAAAVAPAARPASQPEPSGPDTERPTVAPPLTFAAPLQLPDPAPLWANAGAGIGSSSSYGSSSSLSPASISPLFLSSYAFAVEAISEQAAAVTTMARALWPLAAHVARLAAQRRHGLWVEDFRFV
jgi:hypothetical protein